MERPTVLALEQLFQEPVPLTLGRLRDLLQDLLATRVGTRTATISELRPVLARYGLLGLPLSSVLLLVGAVSELPPGAEVADFTPRELESLLARVQ